MPPLKSSPPFSLFLKRPVNNKHDLVGLFDLLVIGLLIATQWELRPWALFSVSFVVIVLVHQVLIYRSDGGKWRLLIIAGGVLNTIALIANQGRMPVLGKDTVDRWWQPLTSETRLVFLCDIYWKWSIGDIVVGTAVLAGVTSWTVTKIKARRRLRDAGSKET